MAFISSTIEKRLPSGVGYLIEERGEKNKEGLEKESLLEKQEQLFEEIEKVRDILSRQDLVNLTARLFEHSAADGLKIAERLSLTPDEILRCLNRPQFFIKHRALAKELKKELEAKKKKAQDREKVEELVQNYQHFEEEIKEGNYSQLLENFSEAESEIEEEKARRLLQELDNLYVEFLRAREVKSEDLADQSPAGERLAEDNLIKAKLALEKRYYSGGILRAIFNELKNREPNFIKEKARDEFNKNKFLAEKYRDFEHYYNFLLKGLAPQEKIALEFLKKQGLSRDKLQLLGEQNLISKNLAEELKEKFGLSDKAFGKAQYKPLGLSFKLENLQAKKELIKEINESLSLHCDEGVEVEYNRQKDEYEITGLKKEKQAEEKEIEKEIELEKGIKVANVIDISGKLAYKAKQGEKQFIVFDGNLSFLTARNRKSMMRLITLLKSLAN